LGSFQHDDGNDPNMKDLNLNTSELFGETEAVTTPQLSGSQYYDANFYLGLLKCRACGCRAEATQVVPGVGPKNAEIIFVGRNPGRDEDAAGQPFVGRGGEELNRMLAELGLDSMKVAILNVVKCHTMGDRPPRPIEIEACTELWLQDELRFFEKASIVIPMGREAINTFLGPTADSPAKREGYWVKVQIPGTDRILNVCPINHPGYILRSGGKKLQMYANTLPAIKKHLIERFPAIYENAKIFS
jgi:DNA polymerase